MRFKLTLLFFVLFLCGCDLGIRQTTTTEYGVIFRKLPPILSGGVSSKIVNPGEIVVVWPWDKLYRFDTSLQYISWGGKKADTKNVDYVYTRALDGNEVALAVTVQYRISEKKDDLIRLVNYVATNNTSVQELVETVARADIRTYMNELRTSSFFDRNARYGAIDKARDAMNKQLVGEGIVIEKVILDEHRFERQLRDGSTDRSYQDKIDETQKIGQDTERELLRVDTIKAQKSQLFNEEQAKFNRALAEADGYSRQAKLRGDAYFEERSNMAKGVLAKGKAEVDGLKQQISALEGEGGRAILKLEIAKNLSKDNPSFVTMPDGGSSTVDLRKLDSNDLLRQIGITEGMKDKEAKEQVKSKE